MSLECDFLKVRNTLVCKRCGRTCNHPGPLRAKCRPRPPDGPGRCLELLLKSIGITASPTCKCRKMARQMDAWGPDGCLEHMDQILDVMQAEAKRRKLPFLRLAGRTLVKIAVRRARKKGNSQ